MLGMMADQGKSSGGSAGALTLDDFNGIGNTDPRRQEGRINCYKSITLLPCVAEELWQFKRAWLVDCSPHGVGLIVSAAIQPGQQFLLKLKLDRLMLVIYTVRHCRPASE